MVLAHLHDHGTCPCSCWTSMFLSMFMLHIKGVCVRVHVRVPVRVHVVCVFMFVCINAGMPDCPASDHSGNGLKKTNDAGTSLVLDQAKAVRHFYGFLDADAQLCLLPMALTQILGSGPLHTSRFCTMTSSVEYINWLSQQIHIWNLGYKSADQEYSIYEKVKNFVILSLSDVPYCGMLRYWKPDASVQCEEKYIVFFLKPLFILLRKAGL
jgi:hypothetical protein